MPSEARVVLCTVPSAEVGEQLARLLVEARLAACVNIIAGVRSIYRWEGEICEDGEHLLVVKTQQDRVQALRERLAEAHPYSCPEIIALEVSAGHLPYLEWIGQQTR